MSWRSPAARSIVEQLTADLDQAEADKVSLARELERVEKANADLCADLEQVEESRRRYAVRAGLAERERDLLRMGAYTPDAQAEIRRLTRELDQQLRNPARLDDRLAAAEGRPVQGVS